MFILFTVLACFTAAFGVVGLGGGIVLIGFMAMGISTGRADPGARAGRPTSPARSSPQTGTKWRSCRCDRRADRLRHRGRLLSRSRFRCYRPSSVFCVCFAPRPAGVLIRQAVFGCTLVPSFRCSSARGHDPCLRCAAAMTARLWQTHAAIMVFIHGLMFVLPFRFPVFHLSAADGLHSHCRPLGTDRFQVAEHDERGSVQTRFQIMLIILSVRFMAADGPLYMMENFLCRTSVSG